MKYNKLVRDKIPEIIKNDDKVPVVHTALDEEYSRKLKEKLVEEVNEYLGSGKEEELADILEVVFALSDFKNIPKDVLEKIRKDKKEKRGSFSKKIILSEVLED
ncbi:phosphoribosyl-ATP pyrophosphohydrolase [archaeon]|nr:phosphoribosyl-ATP pyrophosphohydrolase [archaeon]|tara:strand:- start:2208 stop:2519 length:312 start_codon:yes stop_codon:yes gene_type:complete